MIVQSSSIYTMQKNGCSHPPSLLVCSSARRSMVSPMTDTIGEFVSRLEKPRGELMNVKGVLWIQTATRGRGYMVDVDRTDNFQNYISRRTRFLGDRKRGGKIVETSFRVKGGSFYFGWRKVQLDRYSHAVFNFAAGTLTESRYRKLLEIREHLVERGVEIINDPVNIRVAADKVEFFDLMRSNGFRVPDWKVVQFAEEIPKWPYPFLMRTSNDTGGRNCFKVCDDSERDRAWAEISLQTVTSKRYKNPRIMTVRYIDPFDERFGANVKYRVCLIKDHVFVYYGIPSDDWKIQAVKVIREGRLFTEVNVYAKQLIEESRDTIFRARNVVGLDCVAFDFLVDHGQIVFLEVMPKFGIPNHEDGASFARLEDTSLSTVYNSYHCDPEARNSRAYDMLFGKQGVANGEIDAI